MSMKTTIERLDGDRLRLDVEVPEPIVQEAFDYTLHELSRDLRLPGFRPGKVPPQVAVQRLGREAVIAETIRHFLGEWYVNAVTASGVRPIAEPEIDFSDLAPPGQPYRFSATVQVAPKPTLADLATLEVERPTLPDLDKFVQQVLDQTLKGAAELVPTGTGAKADDEVVVDFTCTVNDTSVLGASATGYQARIGDGRLLDELEAAILGKPAGETLDVPVTFQDDHPMPDLAGNDAVFHLTLREVLEPKLPELTDEVTRKVSEFDTAAELRADIEAAISKRLEAEIQGVFRANAVNALADRSEVAEPAALVEQKKQEVFQSLKQRLAQMGLSIEAYLGMTGKSQDELFDEMDGQAREDVRRELCLLALAEDAKVVVSDEDLKAEIREHTEQTGDDADEAIERVFSSGRVDLLRGELLIQRTIDHLVDQVKAVPGKPLGEAEEEQEEQAEEAKSESEDASAEAST